MPQVWGSIPAQRSNTDTLKKRRRIIWAVLTVVLLSGPAACAISSNALSVAQQSAGATASSVTPTAAAAQTVAQSFLAGTGSPIAVAEGVDPTLGSSSSATPIGEVESIAYAGTTPFTTPTGATYQTSHFWVRSGAVVWDLAVTTTDGLGGPVLAAVPSMQRAVTAAGETGTPSFDGAPTEVSAEDYPGLGERLSIWSAAFGAGDLARLAEISENGPTSTIALGAAGEGEDPGTVFTPSPVQVTSMMSLPDGRLLASVSVSFTSASGYAMDTTYDLLITPKGEGGDLSVINQWGPPGAFSDLTVAKQ